MMADIAHELRTPGWRLFAARWSPSGWHIPASPENSRPIHGQALLLGRLIDDLRDLALARPGVCFGARRGAVDRLTFAGRRGISPSGAGQADRSAGRNARQASVCICGRAALEQVVANLLSNALRHTRRRKGAPEGLVSAALDPLCGTRITGSGIAAEDLPHIFERFFRADRARTRSEGARAWGWRSFVKLVEAHGGSITVESTSGRGATFTVSLPQYSTRQT